MSQGIRGVNLVPKHRRAARRRRRHLHRWSVATALYAIAILGVWAGAHLVWSGADRALAADLRDAAVRVKEVNQELAELRPQLAEAQTTLAASRSIGSKPDWSLLLDLLANLLGEELVLTKCELAPGAAGFANANPPPALPVGGSAVLAPPSGSQRGYRLTLQGFGQSQAAVSTFVLRLEQTGLFDRVQLIDTRTEPYMNGHAAGFRVECFITATAEARP